MPRYATRLTQLWMGTHPTLPSRIRTDDTPYPALNDRLCDETALLGAATVDKFGASREDGALPFLFKVLSISKALSIQAHPDKKLAEKLHGTKPEMYKDANHKPELAIALRDFEGFCGFRPVHEILTFLQSVPELKTAVQLDEAMMEKVQSAAAQQADDTPEAAARIRTALRVAFGALMRAKKEVYESQVYTIAERYRKARDAGRPLEVSDEVAEMVVRLHSQFPGDIGVLCTFFLNIVRLSPGQSVYLGANEPHAYLSGHILECMAASDNVVRAGLTPKARDVDVLVDMLTYESARASDQLLDAPAWDGEEEHGTPTRVYDPPVDEFAVLLTTLRGDTRASTQRAIHGASIVLVVEGEGQLHADDTHHTLHTGQAWFVGADTPLRLTTNKQMTVARAYVEVV